MTNLIKIINSFNLFKKQKHNNGIGFVDDNTLLREFELIKLEENDTETCKYLRKIDGLNDGLNEINFCNYGTKCGKYSDCCYAIKFEGFDLDEIKICSKYKIKK